MQWTTSKIVLIGAGNVATQLGIALQEVGHTIKQVYSRTEQSASKLANLLSISYITEIEQLVSDADIYILSIKDDALTNLLPQLVKGRERSLFLHTAGSVPISIFEGMGISRYGVLYPLQTFSKQRKIDFKTIPLFIEGDSDSTLVYIEKFAKSLTPNIYPQNSEVRKMLHLSAVFACNFVNHCYTIASQILVEQNLPFDLLLPLIEETTAKLHQLNPIEAQTGPALRYDQRIISAQMKLLAENPPAQELYELMSKNIHRVAQLHNNEL